MALTDLQKAQNKAALRVRSAAYKRRREDFQKAVEAAEAADAVKAARAAVDAVSDNLDGALAARTARVDALRAQVAELEEKITQEMACPEIERMIVTRRALNAEWRKVQQQEVERVSQSFPDISGTPAQFSEAAWVPPPEVQAQMEQARDAVSSAA